MGEVVFSLTPNELQELSKALLGQGGFQSFLKKLQKQVDLQSRQITLTDSDLGRIIRHIGYNPGGFEDRLRAAFGSHLKAIIDK